jgi:hypothetical protein
MKLETTLRIAALKAMLPLIPLGPWDEPAQNELHAKYTAELELLTGNDAPPYPKSTGDLGGVSRDALLQDIGWAKKKADKFLIQLVREEAELAAIEHPAMREEKEIRIIRLKFESDRYQRLLVAEDRLLRFDQWMEYQRWNENRKAKLKAAEDNDNAV